MPFFSPYEALGQLPTPTTRCFILFMCCSPAEYASCRDTKDATAGKHGSVSSLNQALTTGAADR